MNEELQRLDTQAKHYYNEGSFLNALLTYAEAFTKYPYLALAHNNYGNIIRELGMPELSYGFLETAIRIDPENKIYLFNLAVAHLLANDLKVGFELFEGRWKFKGHEDTLLGYSKPRYEGQDLKNKTLLITCEEGDGDNIQFSRFTSYFESMGAKVIHQTEPNLQRLFQNSFRNSLVKTNRDVVINYDYWTPILSIPRVLKIDSYENMPKVSNYLKPSKQSITKAKKILPKGKKKIGICYSGRTKSYPFDKIVDLIKSLPQFQWVNFQIICDETERQILKNIGVFDFSENITDWEDTAGFMNEMDCVVTIDTGLCHLAGSMGIHTVLLLDRFKTCWRWLLNTESTHWYDNMKLFRQQDYKSYDEQLVRVRNHLTQIK